MADPRVVSIPKAPPIRDEVVRRLVLAKIASDGKIVLGQGVPLVYVETLADAPTGLLPGTVAFGKDGSFGQVNSSGTLVSRGAAGSLSVASGGALTFDGTDIVLTADGTDVDLTGTGKLDARDDVLHFVDPAAPTKRVRIDAGSVTAGQTRVLAMPDADITLPAAGVQPLSATLTALAAAGLDEEVVATVTAPNGSGGTNTSAVTVQLYRRDGTTPIASVREVLLQVGTVQYLDAAGPSNASVSLADTTGTSVAVVAGSLFKLTTNASGLYAGTLTESDDGTLYLSAKTASGGVATIGQRCTVTGSNSTTTVFSA